jgi:hypothetical protein
MIFANLTFNHDIETWSQNGWGCTGKNSASFHLRQSKKLMRSMQEISSAAVGVIILHGMSVSARIRGFREYDPKTFETWGDHYLREN